MISLEPEYAGQPVRIGPKLDRRSGRSYELWQLTGAKISLDIQSLTSPHVNSIDDELD